MPSLFSRARTNSTPNKKSTLPSDDGPYAAGGLDEFGRVSSRTSHRGATLGTPASKKDKKKEQKRNKALPPGREDTVYSPDSPFPDGAFLPLNLERPAVDGGATEFIKGHDYGYLAYERHVVLGLDQVERLVEVISEELETRGGITTPFIFSTTALDISASSIRRIIRSFLATCANQSGASAQVAEGKWREEARFAGPHELAMCLRWGLARVIRSVGGQDVRGLVSWEHYVDFRESEAALGYPPAHFATNFLPELAPPLQAIIIRLLSLLARLVSNSTSSGHTPPTLSPLFGPLFFGLGPATLAFHHAYVHYLRAVTAMEHLILAFVRWQDLPRVSVSSAGLASNQSGSAGSLGVPVRLKEWIKGYPAMLPAIDQKKPQPRRGARTVRVMSVRRNVRMYSPDLVKTASVWAYRPAGAHGHNPLASSKEWDRIAPPTLKLAPRYSEGYKMRMSMPVGFHPDVAPGASPALKMSESYSSATSSGTVTSLPDPDYFGLGTREGEDRFRSLTDLKWGEFESMGFSGLGDEKKLQFDLTESARTDRSAKRQTLSWNDFSSAGFSRMDAPLSATLQFSTPLTNKISSWPAQNAEISKKLKKTHKALPAFGWDTEPVIGNEEIIEEAFVDVFCDLIYGGGWMDLERGEMLDRDCNWALVEYKSLPAGRSTASGGADPRTATTLMLFEEFVPLEYREQLAVKSSSRRRLPSLFSSPGRKQWKQAATLNGRPYVVGHVPQSPSFREVEFEGMLHASSSTKQLSLNARNSTRAPPLIGLPSSPAPPLPTVRKVPSRSRFMESPREVIAPLLPGPKSDEIHSDSTASPSVKKSLFRLPPTPGSNRRSMIPAEYSTVEFETRMASYSDDDVDASGARDAEPDHVRQKRRESNADAWVDILVGSQTRRFGGQDAEFGVGDTKRNANRGTDPESASLEVAQVLAAVRNRSPSPESVMQRVDQDFGIDSHIDDLDIDEVDVAPRGDALSYSGAGESDDDGGLAYDESSVGHGQLDADGMPVGMSALQLAQQQRRLGYFDLHPERRPAQTQSVAEDPRAKLAASNSDSEDEDEDAPVPVRLPPDVRPLPRPPMVPVVPPKEPPALALIEPKPLVLAKAAGAGQKPEVRIARTASPPSNAQAVPVTAAATPSKTAALIEMYRERERGTPPKPTVSSASSPVPIVIAPLAPSRLPVRSVSLPKETVSLPPTPAVPAVAPPPKSSPESFLEPAPTLIDLPRITLEETGRSSPARYIHGAPLQNVIEEEEE
ncbi:hypothetical protein HYPSUDRAFT_207491 [Hypholoma sublateritium FD-334 SS-4]|uniref:Meiotically up-regulated protein Msb1/Mug8 domain-containing protein n=1 Tax=Hypholoma sublateritium (strain FD-334 SS-4) TaxID=945553 RepID=A0A0D2KMR9_HYPSF|nr:hypothetical protein HYPSUDRAFT_207491 [Hypholoma sublateritium FD-334 SS-4]